MALAEGLETNGTLKRLDLRANGGSLGVAGLLALRTALVRHQSIVYVVIDAAECQRRVGRPGGGGDAGGDGGGDGGDAGGDGGPDPDLVVITQAFVDDVGAACARNAAGEIASGS